MAATRARERRLLKPSDPNRRRKAAVRIAYVTETYPPELNGVSLTAERSVRQLRQRGHQVEVIRPRQAGDAAQAGPDEFLTHGCPIPMYPALRFGVCSSAALRR